MEAPAGFDGPFPRNDPFFVFEGHNALYLALGTIPVSDIVLISSCQSFVDIVIVSAPFLISF